MRVFQHRKPAANGEPRNALATLRQTLTRLEAEPVETEQIAELKRLLATGLRKLKRKIGTKPANRV